MDLISPQNKIIWDIHDLKHADVNSNCISENCMTSWSLSVTFLLKLNLCISLSEPMHTLPLQNDTIVKCKRWAWGQIQHFWLTWNTSFYHWHTCHLFLSFAYMLIIFILPWLSFCRWWCARVSSILPIRSAISGSPSLPVLDMKILVWFLSEIGLQT